MCGGGGGGGIFPHPALNSNTEKHGDIHSVFSFVLLQTMEIVNW